MKAAYNRLKKKYNNFNYPLENHKDRVETFNDVVNYVKENKLPLIVVAVFPNERRKKYGWEVWCDFYGNDDALDMRGLEEQDWCEQDAFKFIENAKRFISEVPTLSKLEPYGVVILNLY